MTTRDYKNVMTAAVERAAAAITTNTTTNQAAGTDVKDQAAVVLQAFTNAYTDGTFTLNAQESDDDSTWADVPSERVDGEDETLGAANSIVNILVQTQMRYVRLQIVSTGVTSGATVGINSIVFSS